MTEEKYEYHHVFCAKIVVPVSKEEVELISIPEVFLMISEDKEA